MELRVTGSEGNRETEFQYYIQQRTLALALLTFGLY